jgi:hypothetical protein
VDLEFSLLSIVDLAPQSQRLKRRLLAVEVVVGGEHALPLAKDLRPEVSGTESERW